MSDLLANLAGKPPATAPGPTLGTSAGTPAGPASLAFRTGTQASFRARLLAALATIAIPDGPYAGSRPLADLAVLDPSDPAIALVDAWAAALDVLTFYQERIANEGFLPTAGERRSLLELANLVGYALSPGLAASAFLAFTVEEGAGGPESVVVPAATQVQSIPGQDAQPQTFETASEITARAAWNALAPRLSRPQVLPGATAVYLAGTATGLAPADLLVVVGSDSAGVFSGASVARVQALATDDALGSTRVDLAAPLAMAPAASFAVFALRTQADFFGHSAPNWGSLPRSSVFRDDPFDEAVAASNWDTGRTVWTDSQGRLLSSLRGFEANLDGPVAGLVAGGWVVLVGTTLDGGEATEVYRLTAVASLTLADYSLSGPATALGLAGADGSALPGEELLRTRFDFRRTRAYLASEELARAEEPIVAPLPNLEEDGGFANLTLAGEVTGLALGQPIALRGERSDGTGPASELFTLHRIDAVAAAGGAGPWTRLQFDRPLAASYQRESVRLNANVVLASHGETVSETLGSGDGTQARQRFALQRSPLTYHPAPAAGGVASSLSVRVDGVAWREVKTLAAVDGASRSFMIERDDGGGGAERASVVFGDGQHGARLPSGFENVTAVYRTGLGAAGAVPAGALSLLVTRPLGVSEVTNPLAASGAAPEEDVEAARRNAPLAARTLGRLVSQRDFEDFSRAFAGIAKVQAAPLLGLHLTVAGVGGSAVVPGSELYRNLVQAITDLRLPGPPVRVDSYAAVPFRLAAKLLLDPAYLPREVFAVATAALAGAFGFDRRELGQGVEASAVIAVLQTIEGVVAVDLDALYLEGEEPAFQSSLRARPARLEGGRVRPAELLQLAADGVLLRSRTP